MVDLAKVGFSADTSPLKQAADDLDAFKQRAQGVGDSLDKVNESAAKSADALNKAGTDIQNAGKSVEAAGTSAKTAGDQIDGLSASANKASDALSKTATTAEAAGKQIDATASSVKDVSDKLDKTSEAAGKASDAAKATGDNLSTAGRAANDAAGSMSKTASSANEVAAALVEAAAQSGKYQGATAQIEQIAAKTGVSYAQAAQALKTATDAQKAVSTATSIASNEAARSTSIWGALANALGLSSSSMAVNTASAHELAKSHKEASEFGTQFRETVHTLAPALDSVGVKMSSLTQFSGAARLGLAGIAAAAGGALVVEMAKAGDEAINLRQRLEGLAGVKVGRQLADDMSEVAREVGVTRSALQPALESLIKFQNLHGPTNMLPPGMSQQFHDANIQAANLTEVVKTMYETLRTGGADPAVANAAVNKFFADAAKNGKVTAEMFADLQNASPRAAQAIADAFTRGRLNADEFEKHLKDVPLALKDWDSMLLKTRDAVQDAFQDMMDDPTKFGDAVDKLKSKFTELWETLSEPNKDGNASPITKAVSSIADGVELAGQKLESTSKLIEADIDRINKKLEEESGAGKKWYDGIVPFLVSADKDGGDAMGSFVTWLTKDQTDASNTFGRLTTSLRDFNNSGSEQLRQFNQSVIDYMSSAWAAIESFVAKIASAAKSVASSIASMISDAIHGSQTAASAAQSATTGGASGGSGSSVPQAAQGGVAGYTTPPSGYGSPTASSGGTGPSGSGSSVFDTGTTPFNDYSGGSSLFDTGTSAFNDYGSSVGDVAQQYMGGFAIGGQFTVDGSGGTDSQLVQFMATPGEVVTITPPGGGAPPDPSMSPIAAAVTSGLTPIAANDNSSPTGALSDSLASQTDSITSKFAQNIAGQTDGITKKLDETTGLITAAIAAQTGALENFWTEMQAKAEAKAASVAASGGATGSNSSLMSTDGFGGSTQMPMIGVNSIFGPMSTATDANGLPIFKPTPYTIGGVSYGTGATGNGLGSWLNPNPNGAPTYSRSSSGVTRAPAPSSSVSSQPSSSAYDSTGGIDISHGGSMLPPSYGGSNTSGSSSGPTNMLPPGYGSGDSVFDTGASGFDSYGSDSYFGADSFYAGAYATGGSFTVPGGGGIDTTLVMMRATAGEQVSVSQPGATAGGGGGNLPPIIMNVYAKDADSFLKSKDQIAAEFARAVAEAQKAA